MRQGLFVLLALIFTQGCTTSYEPARSPRIETVVEGGQPTFVKDGVHFGGPVWGSGLADAVHGNPRAEHHARVGRNLIVGGFVVSLAGLGAEIGGLVVLAKDNNSSTAGDSNSGVAAGLVIGGVVVALTGCVMMLAGQPHIYDAINIYNDGIAARPTPAPLGPRVQ
jgi:hypothetical protein